MAAQTTEKTCCLNSLSITRRELEKRATKSIPNALLSEQNITNVQRAIQEQVRRERTRRGEKSAKLGRMRLQKRREIDNLVKAISQGTAYSSTL